MQTLRLSLAIAMLVACGKDKPPAPAGPVPALVCDYKADLLGKTSHRCTEVRDPEIVESQRAWWAKIDGPRDKVTCTPHARCPVDGRTAACMHPNGNLEWSYTDSAAEVKRTCTIGRFVTTGEVPPRPPVERYRCARPPTCQEIASVVDLVPTVEAKNCETGGGAFAKGACPAENAVGRCKTSSSTQESLWVVYAPATGDDARALCTRLEGVFLTD